MRSLGIPTVHRQNESTVIPICAWSLSPTVFDSYLRALVSDRVSVERKKQRGKMERKSTRKLTRRRDCLIARARVAPRQRTIPGRFRTPVVAADIPQSRPTGCIAALFADFQSSEVSGRRAPIAACRSRSRSCRGHGDGAPVLGHSRSARGQDGHRDLSVGDYQPSRARVAATIGRRPAGRLNIIDCFLVVRRICGFAVNPADDRRVQSSCLRRSASNTTIAR